MSDIFELFKKIEKENGSERGPVSFIVACLGNPGKEYAITRHNAGYLFAEHYSKKRGFKIDRSKFEGLYGECMIGDKRGIFICPTTYMNLSGISVRAAADFYKISSDKIIVICDDVNLDVGKIRIRRKGSDGGQRGVRSITEHLKTEAFPRIKIGVGRKPCPEYDLADWVLGKFSKEDQSKLADVFDNASIALELVIKGDFETAMNRYN